MSERPLNIQNISGPEAEKENRPFDIRKVIGKEDIEAALQDPIKCDDLANLMAAIHSSTHVQVSQESFTFLRSFIDRHLSSNSLKVMYEVKAALKFLGTVDHLNERDKVSAQQWIDDTDNIRDAAMLAANMMRVGHPPKLSDVFMQKVEKRLAEYEERESINWYGFARVASAYRILGGEPHITQNQWSQMNHYIFQEKDRKRTARTVVMAGAMNILAADKVIVPKEGGIETLVFDKQMDSDTNMPSSRNF